MEAKADKAILPQDIIMEILKRLPVKSLIRFQSVCKLWNNLIKSPSFITDHLRYSTHNNPFLLFDKSHHRHISPLLFLIDSKMKIVDVQMTPLTCNSSRHAVKLVGSCNGLLCVEIDYNDDDEYFRSFLLWNPATREVRQVPRSTNNYLCMQNLGFGFSPAINDYKIVRIYKRNYYAQNQHQVNLDKICVHQVEVYSLSTGSWKKLESVVINRASLRRHQPVIANGTMFWLGTGNEDDHHMVVSFDIAMEVFSLIPIPSSISSYVKLTVYENKLAMFRGPCKIGNTDSYFLDLWVMEEGSGTSGKSWTKKYSIAPTSNWLYPFCIWRNEIVCTRMTYSIPYRFMDESESESEMEHETGFFLSLFNLTTNKSKFHSFTRHIDYYDNVFNYVESLVCLQHPQ